MFILTTVQSPNKTLVLPVQTARILTRDLMRRTKRRLHGYRVCEPQRPNLSLRSEV